MNSPIIFWFRNDLRIDDHPGLAAALETGAPIIPCYILDDDSPGEWCAGGAGRWWLHHSLAALGSAIEALGGGLVLRRGDSREVLPELARASGASAIYCSRQYEPWAAQLETQLHQQLGAVDVELRRYPGTLLFEPEAVSNLSGQPFRVFTPFWRKCRGLQPAARLDTVSATSNWYRDKLATDTLESWSLTPKNPDWAEGWQELWQPGSEGARHKLQLFLRESIRHYSDGRDHPALDCTTRLSPHLHFGEISPRTLWHAAIELASESPELDGQVEKFLSELGWREFSYHLLHHFPAIPEQAFNPTFGNFPWISDEEKLRAWQRGRTGYPIVDAGMRELWQTGYMHNRVRMITASFLTKHLLIHWRAGAEWFWDTLLDADLANNSCSWQWVAGSGADASPYFRIFNPILQGKKFDAKGEYIRRWIPEIAALPDRYLNSPWEAPADVLQEAGIELGESYPQPLVDHPSARESALAAYAEIKGR